MLFVTGKYPYQQHTLKLIKTAGDATCKAIGIDGIYYLNNDGHGMFEVENKEISIPKRGSAQINIRRVGGSIGSASVRLQTISNTAIQGEHFNGIDQTVTFGDGVSERSVDIHTFDYRNPVLANLTFTIKIDTPTSAILGFDKASKITIIDSLSEPAGLGTILHSEAYTTGNWGSGDGGTYTKEVGAKMVFSFFGTKAWLYGTFDPNHGYINITVDNNPSITLSTIGARSTKSLYYTTEDLEDRGHIIIIEYIGRGSGIEIYSLQYVDNNANGLIDFESNYVQVKKGESTAIKLVRVGGTKGSTSVSVKSTDISAISSTNYQPIDQTINFS